MPYHTTDDLPQSVKSRLPRHAQELYLKAYNEAWITYHNSPDKEPICLKKAWEAVEQEYEKDAEGTWHKKKAVM